MGDVIQISIQEVGIVIVLSIHFEHQKHIFSTSQKPLSIVLCHS